MSAPLGQTNFLVLGAAKSGTSMICYAMDQHPDVYVAPVKEPIFFEAEYEEGLDYYWQTYYPDWDGQSAVGEGRVFNLFIPFVAARIRQSLPDARLIAVLRNPVERAYSHWWHRWTIRQEKLGFAEAIEANLERIAAGLDFEGESGPRVWKAGQLHVGAMASRYRLYLDCGRYAEQLRRYLDLFPAEQLEIVLYDDLRADLLGVIRSLWTFVGVDATLEPGELPDQNIARTLRWSRLRAALNRYTRGFDAWDQGPLQTIANKLDPGRVVERPPLDTETHRKLLDYYAEPNAELQKLLRRDLSAWNRLPS